MNTVTPTSTPAPKPKEPKVGDWFLDTDLGGNLFILARTDHDKYCLVSIQDGNRYREPTPSLEEAGVFDRCLVPISKVNITYTR